MGGRRAPARLRFEVLAHATVALDGHHRFHVEHVFNALRSDELLLSVGRVLRLLADAPGALEEYERSQALSALSVTRLLAAEQVAGTDLLAWTRDALAGALDGDGRPEVAVAAAGVEQATTGIELGDVLATLLAALPPDDATRTRLHRVLAEMIDREVAALAAVAS